MDTAGSDLENWMFRELALTGITDPLVDLPPMDPVLKYMWDVIAAIQAANAQRGGAAKLSCELVNPSFFALITASNDVSLPVLKVSNSVLSIPYEVFKILATVRSASIRPQRVGQHNRKPYFIVEFSRRSYANFV
jgi:hypothetical protein